MLDSDLARLYGVEARALNQAVARNRKRFPADFMFQLTDKEYERIRSQFVTRSGRAEHSSQTVMSTRKPSRTPLSSLRIHRTRRGDALKRPAQLSRGRGEHCHNAHFCAAASSDGFQSGPRSQN